MTAFKCLPLDLPARRGALADAGYPDDAEEARWREGGARPGRPAPRGNCRRPLAPWLRYLCQRRRQRVETVFSQAAGGPGRGTSTR